MTIAWRDFLVFAIESDELRQAFTAATGIKFPEKPKSGLDMLIDEATGHTNSVIRDYVFWATLTQWGDVGVPAEFIAEANARFPTPGTPT